LRLAGSAGARAWVAAALGAAAGVAGVALRVDGGARLAERLLHPVSGCLDRAQRLGVGHIALQPSELGIVRLDGLLQPTLFLGGGLEITRTEGVDVRAGILDLNGKPGQRLLGEIIAVATEHGLCLPQAGAGQLDDAVKAYDQAAQLDPTRASMFYFNKGAVQTNSGKVDEAIDSFKKVIATDPNKADAYYWLGVNMIGKATLKGDKMVAPEGTAEMFNKYLELAPTGPFAEPAKQMLSSIGATIETQFGKKKSSKK